MEVGGNAWHEKKDTHSHTNWERGGVKPDVMVPAKAALDVATMAILWKHCDTCTPARAASNTSSVASTKLRGRRNGATLY
jgi:hypothetical protein